METGKINSYKDLLVWQKSIDLVADCYKLTEKFPSVEIYGLTQQLRRASVSIPSNIAEGNGRQSKNEYVHFLYISRGSLKEVETQLIIAERLNFISKHQLAEMLQKVDEIGRMLTGLIRSIKK
jgi:four helix bundle protein